MRSRMMVENPGEVEVTIKMTMKLKSWIELRDTLKPGWPASDLAYQISDAVSKVQKVFYADEKPEDAQP